VAEIQYAAGRADVFVNDKLFYRTGDTVRLTDLEGNLQSVTGIADTKANVMLEIPSGQNLRFSVDISGFACGRRLVRTIRREESSLSMIRSKMRNRTDE